MSRVKIGALAAAALIAAASAYAWWSRRDGTVEPAYVTQAVERGSVAAIVTATGTVNPVTQVQVGTYVSGRIDAIGVDFNSEVKKGQRVAKIDPRPFQVKVQQAEANLASAKARVEKDRADLSLKKLTLDRSAELLERKLLSQSDLDNARSQYDQAVAQLALDQAAIAQATAAVEEARINLDYTDIVSPVDGVVVSRNVDVGQTVAASFQTPTLFVIAEDLTKMQVNTSVSESDIGQIGSGDSATFSVDAYPGRAFYGSVQQVRNSPTVVQNVVTYDVVIGVDNPDLALKPGMTAMVTITTARREGVLKVPLRGLRFRPERATATPAVSGAAERATVWRVGRDGTLAPVEIETGVRNDEEAEVVSGDLEEGDRLAVAYQGQRQSTDTTAQSPFSPRRYR